MGFCMALEGLPALALCFWLPFKKSLSMCLSYRASPAPTPSHPLGSASSMKISGSLPPMASACTAGSSSFSLTVKVRTCSYSFDQFSSQIFQLISPFVLFSIHTRAFSSMPMPLVQVCEHVIICAFTFGLVIKCEALFKITKRRRCSKISGSSLHGLPCFV